MLDPLEKFTYDSEDASPFPGSLEGHPTYTSLERLCTSLSRLPGERIIFYR